MTYEEFVTCIAAGLKKKFGEDFTIKQFDTFKNNGVYYKGISIHNCNSNLAPTIYLNEFYEKYNAGVGVERIVDEIRELYEQIKFDGKIDTCFFTDYERASKCFAFKLINYERNKELLATVPHRKFMDLAIVYLCVLKSCAGSNASVLVKNEHLKLWGKSEQDLYKDALEQSPKLLPVSLRDIADVINDKFEGSVAECPAGEMFVLSNEDNYYGAACVLYDGLMESVADFLQEDFVVLPSSIHELILVPDRLALDYNKLRDVVSCINDTRVDIEEVLSYTVYHYSRGIKKLHML